MIPAYLYQTVFLYLILILTINKAAHLNGRSYQMVYRGEGDNAFAMLLCVALALYIGVRPVSYLFGDTWSYNYTYSLMKNHIEGSYMTSSEWIWRDLMYACSQVVDVSVFFTIVSFGYFGFNLWACRLLTPDNILVSFLFILGGLSFFTYGTNGIRNGLALSMVLVSMPLLTRSKSNLFIIALVILFVAYNIHHSIIVPVASLFASIYVVKNFKWAYTFWIFSILVSLVAGGTVTSFFASLGFDERTSYLTTTSAEGTFSHTGFRWDFLIYSMMPIVLGYYVVIKKRIQDRKYLILLNTYTMANAFWVMVIRANYSNRFAYLSWFMYPIVLAYPLLKLDIWGNQQGKRASQIMLAQIAFTWFMETFYW